MLDRSQVAPSSSSTVCRAGVEESNGGMTAFINTHPELISSRLLPLPMHLKCLDGQRLVGEQREDSTLHGIIETPGTGVGNSF